MCKIPGRPRPGAIEGLGLAHPIQMLYKVSLKTEEIIIDLKRAIIAPIYKVGSRNLPKNYGSVVLTSNLIKILDKLLAKNIHQFLETRQKMNPKQHGFRSGRSCLSQLLDGASQPDI